MSYFLSFHSCLSYFFSIFFSHMKVHLVRVLRSQTSVEFTHFKLFFIVSNIFLSISFLSFLFPFCFFSFPFGIFENKKRVHSFRSLFAKVLFGVVDVLIISFIHTFRLFSIFFLLRFVVVVLHIWKKVHIVGGGTLNICWVQTH